MYVVTLLAGFKDFLRKVRTSSTNPEHNQKILYCLVFRSKSSVKESMMLEWKRKVASIFDVL